MEKIIKNLFKAIGAGSREWGVPGKRDHTPVTLLRGHGTTTLYFLGTTALTSHLYFLVEYF